MSTEPATVTLTLGSTSYVLTPTVNHMRVLNRLAGGFVPLYRAVGNLEGDTMALIIAAGIGIRGKAVEDLTRAVYEAGLENLVDDITRFIGLCSNGGRDPAAARAKPAGDADTGKAPGASEPVDGDAPETGLGETETLAARELTAA